MAKNCFENSVCSDEIKEKKSTLLLKDKKKDKEYFLKAPV